MIQLKEILIGPNYHQMLIDSNRLICQMLRYYNFKKEQIMKVVNLQIHKCRALLDQGNFNQANLQLKEDGRRQDNK